MQCHQGGGSSFPLAVCGQPCARSLQGCTGRPIVRANSVGLAADVPRASACAAAPSGAGRDPQRGCDTAVRPRQDPPALRHFGRFLFLHAGRSRSYRARTQIRAWAIGSHHPLAKQPFDHAAFLAWPRLAIGVATATDLSREPPARKDLVSRVILETNDEADSPRLGQRATTSMVVYDATTAIRWYQPDRNDHAEFIRMLGATVAGSIPKGVKTLLALFGPHAMSKLSLFAAHGPNDVRS